jgi:DNA primase
VDFADICWTAHQVKAFLDELGIAVYVKTTGNRGLHLYAQLEPRWTAYEVRAAAVALARELERLHPDRITAQWWKEERGARVFIDFNQNAPHKTVFGAWSVRPRVGGQVSTPIAWDEVDGVDPDRLTMATVPPKVDAEGDPWAAMYDAPQSIEPLLAMSEADMAAGLMDAPWPPVYPKMPNEPPRVAPSRARKGTDGG